MKEYKVGVVGATGMVGQRFVSLLENHPWFRLAALAASPRSAGKTYEEAVGARWAMPTPMPGEAKKMVVMDAADVAAVAAKVDFVFCAVDAKKDEIKALEAYAKAECPVVSNNSAHRFTPDVPMVVPEINAEHIEVISAQRARLGTKRGFIAVKSNCSLQAMFPLHPLMLGLRRFQMPCVHPIRLFPVQARPLRPGPKWLTTAFHTSAVKRKKARKSRSSCGAILKTDRSFRPTSPPLLPSACALRAQTATWRRVRQL